MDVLKDVFEDEVCDLDIVVVLTRINKLIILKYLRQNIELIKRPEDFRTTVKQLCTELNKVSEREFSNSNWIGLIKIWVDFITDEYYQERKTKLLSPEDRDLLNLLNSSILSEPTTVEFSCILDSLEVAENSLLFWKTIALELNALGMHKYDYKEWRKLFIDWCTKVKQKKEMLDEFSGKLDDVDSFFTEIEERLLKFMHVNEYDLEINDEEFICRVCLNKTCKTYLNIHTEILKDKKLAEIINICTEIPKIEENDSLPKYICEGCFNLLEIAFKFKVLCEETDNKLRMVEENDNTEDSMGERCLEYIVEETSDIETNNEVVIEINLKSDDEIVPIEIECNNKEEISTIEHKTRCNSISTEIPETTDQGIQQCGICGVVCYSEETLKIHLHSHEIERPHRCSVCKKRFKTKVSLKLHTRSHTGERPYVCKTCGKAFKTWSASASHRVVHSNDKVFKCQLCPYQANTKANLRTHSRVHTGVQPYACEKCPLRFSTASNRLKHIRNVHEKIKRHKCLNCNRNFCSKESLRKHTVVHTGLKPFTCSECPMAYAWHNGLQKHIKSQHGITRIPPEKHYLKILDTSLKK